VRNVLTTFLSPFPVRTAASVTGNNILSHMSRRSASPPHPDQVESAFLLELHVGDIS
jgi:hypothetical protein